jgi:pilus assembly protein Flp/PilA
MKRIVNGIRRFVADESGATAIEYGMMVALIAIVIIVAVAGIGVELDKVYDKVLDCLKDPAACK